MTKLLRIVATMIACDASAHEIETHHNITAQAIAYLQNTQPTKYACAADINTALQTGAADEDSTFPDLNSFPLGRFYFHFFGNNRQPLNGLGQSATCISEQWGFDGNPCTAHNAIALPGLFGYPPLSTTPITKTNDHDWNAAVQHAVDPITGLPSNAGFTDLGYVVHLLEDLTSPAHTRNDPHPCPAGIFFCEPFEKVNKGKLPTMPIAGSLLGSLTDPSTLSSPQQFFEVLQGFVRGNYFSHSTAFDSLQPGPLPVISEDSQYFYGPCLSGSDPGCIGGLRKIAHKNPSPKLASNRAAAFIDDTIAAEQFSELGPIIVQYVAAFIDLYLTVASPKLCGHILSISTTGEGSGDIISTPGSIQCGTAGTHCSAYIQQGSTITITVTPDAQSTFSNWFCSGSANLPPSSNPMTLTIEGDTQCTAIFATRKAAAISSFSCVETFKNSVEFTQLIQASGTLSGPKGFIAIIREGAGAFPTGMYTPLGSEITTFDCGAWTANVTSGTCTRENSQPIQTTWQETSALQWASSIPNPPPLNGGVSVSYRNGSLIILASQSGCVKE